MVNKEARQDYLENQRKLSFIFRHLGESLTVQQHGLCYNYIRKSQGKIKVIE